MEYIAYLLRVGSVGYRVTFPDLAGLETVGRTLEEARTRAAEALGEHLAGIAERGEDAPEASTLDELADDDRMRGAVVVLVSAEAPEKTVRVNITARESQIEAIDRLARKAGMTRSAFLVQTAIREGGGRQRVAAD